VADKTQGQGGTGDPTRARALTAAACLLVMAPLVDADVLGGWRPGAVLSMPLLAAYFFLSRHRLATNARIMLALCVGFGALMLFRPEGAAVLLRAAERMTFFPVFVAMLGLLRAAADSSDTAARAGAMLVRQPPGRRYAALTAGGHIFGILLNIGGLSLLLDMTKRANTLEAGFGDPHIVELREKRMTLAVMRGFACIALWSPLGLALNLLLASVPGLAWVDVAPYGLGVALIFMILGFVLDRLESPMPRRAIVKEPDPAGRQALLKLVGHILALSGLTLTADLATGLSFQAILINLVPIYALVWLLVTGFARKDGKIWSFAGRALIDGGLARWSGFANEIAVFAASGFLGVVLVALAPRALIQHAIIAAALPPGVLAAGLAGSVIALGFLGINPMISTSILAGTMASLAVPGLSNANIVLALAGGWAIVIGLAPLMSSLVMTAALIGRRSSEVGLRWNLRFSLAAAAFWLTALIFIRI
jgi:hypothetical protein